MRPQWILLITAVCFHYSPTGAKRSQGVISSKREFVYLDRFCFQSETGALEYTIKYPLMYPTQMLLLYFDDKDQWPRAYKELTECKDRVQLLTNRSDSNQVIYLSPFFSDLSGNGRCQISRDPPANEWVVCTGTRVFRSARSRWWFLALANCNPNEEEEELKLFNNETFGVYADFLLQMTNGLPSEVLKYQFSIDEWLILPSDTLFLILQCILAVIVFFIGRSLAARRLYHNTFRMCSQALLMNTLGLALIVGNYVVFALDGIGLPLILAIGQLIRAFTDMIYMYVILVLSRGLNITKMRLTFMDKLFLLIMTIIFSLTYFLMLFWEIKYFDPAEVYARSESLPAYLLAVWRLTAWVFFVVASLFSRNASPQKSSFFSCFILLMTPWFWAPPIFTIIANFVLNNWVRAEVVNTVDNSVSFYGYLVFMYLSRPSDSNQNFPFHIRTTQVDIDVGFDPQTAYQQGNGDTPDDGMHGVIELTVNPNNRLSKENSRDDEDKDKGVIERPQFTN